MRGIRLIHIAPELPPTVGGVADYTSILSRRLVEVSDGAVRPTLVHAGIGAAESIDTEFPTINLSEGYSAEDVTDAIDQLASKSDGQVVVLLQYSIYGYHRKGIPWNLVQGLIRTCEGRIPLVTMIHEMFATGLPWEGSFWYSALQQFIALRLARVSARMIVNRRSAASWLKNWHRFTGKESISVQPVFSNVGEPDDLPAFHQRLRRAVAFGGKKTNIYENHSGALRDLTGRVGFNEVVDIGPSDGLEVNPESVAFRGILPASTVSEELVDASLGLLSYPASRLSKSGGASAYASHGVPFVLFDEEKEDRDPWPYVEGEHFWRWETIQENPDVVAEPRLEEMSQALRSLYEKKIHSRLAGQRFLNELREAMAETYDNSPSTA